MRLCSLGKKIFSCPEEFSICGLKGDRKKNKRKKERRKNFLNGCVEETILGRNIM
jgi:predicted metal-dependent peptidase